MLVGEHLIGPLYRHGSAGADIAVVEGVMGLFDGRIDAHAAGPARGFDRARRGLLGAPVVLVVDARGQSHSVAALLHGFATFDHSVRIAGVILNRVGSPRHEQVLRQACEQAGVPVLGAIPRADELAVPSRHLGLVTAVEHGSWRTRRVEAMTDAGRPPRRSRRRGGRRRLATSAPRRGTPRSPNRSADGVTVALAAGKAFTSATPSTPSCCAPRAPTSSSSIR